MRLQKTIGLSLALIVASSAAMARQNQPAHHQPAPAVKTKPASPAVKAKPAAPAVKATTAKKAAAATRTAGKRHKASGKAVARPERRHRGEGRQIAAALPPADEYIGPMQVTGQREIGSAAWYGGRHLGKRTASGEPLDAVRVTAAHRSLPLHSLVRVTNLSNGRSVVAKINDRGPVSRKLVIDMSPRAAQELDMKRAGIVRVAIEPVAPAGGVGNSSDR